VIFYNITPRKKRLSSAIWTKGVRYAKKCSFYIISLLLLCSTVSSATEIYSLKQQAEKFLELLSNGDFDLAFEDFLKDSANFPKGMTTYGNEDLC